MTSTPFSPPFGELSSALFRLRLIEEGALADFQLLDGNPLANINPSPSRHDPGRSHHRNHQRYASNPTNNQEEHTAQYNAEFARYDKYPDEWMGPRGVANDKTRHLACAGAWGLFPNKDAVYINYNGKLPANQCHTATYTVPENKGFWSITVYGADGYMKSANSVLNQYNTTFNADGTFTAYFGSKEVCDDVPNRVDVSEGWNFLMRVYRPGESVLHGSYKLSDAVPSKK